ncbi:MAG TPA: PilZ domain-containing protein [Candidatus Methanoperedens sp.]|nr:PilZ domain-containing protein [Candidatus Methanoperedens sp.]
MGTFGRPPAGPAPRASGGSERRRQRRVDLRVPLSFAEVAAHEHQNRHGVTLDVSRIGVRFRAEDFIAPRAFVALEMILPGGGTYAARGRAIWAREARGDGHWEIGAELLRSGGDADAALAETLLLHER